MIRHSDRFGASSITINKSSALDAEELALIKKYDAEQTKSAIYIKIPKRQLSLHVDHFIDEYKFHHVETIDIDGAPVECYIYYKWNNKEVEDKVPPYATSIAGAGVLLLSPDTNEILLVLEYGKFKMITGTNPQNELTIDTAIREVEEEVGVKINTDISPRMIGSWNISGVKLGIINDHFTCYAMVASSKEFKVDGFEITEAKWFDWRFLLDAHKYMLDNLTKLSSPDLTSAYIEYEGVKLGYATLVFYVNYIDHKGFDLKTVPFQNRKLTILH